MAHDMTRLRGGRRGVRGRSAHGGAGVARSGTAQPVISRDDGHELTPTSHSLTFPTACAMCVLRSALSSSLLGSEAQRDSPFRSFRVDRARDASGCGLAEVHSARIHGACIHSTLLHSTRAVPTSRTYGDVSVSSRYGLAVVVGCVVIRRAWRGY